MSGANTSSRVDNNPFLPYYCYTCQVNITPITEDVLCPHCRDGFVIATDQRDVLVEGEENFGQANPQQDAEGLGGGPVNYSMVEASLRNAMNMGIMQPGFISFSINGQPPQQITIPSTDAASGTTTSSGRGTASSAAASPGLNQAGSSSGSSRPPRPPLFSSSISSGNVRLSSDGLPEIEMIHDIISRVFGNGAESLMLPTGNGAPWRVGELHGNPQDYAWGQNGFDNIISQLLGQLDNVGPPPAARETIESLPDVVITSKNIEDLAECSVCMDFFKLDEKAKKLPCNHLFHKPCIVPWLDLHNTCPICRKQVGRTRRTSTSSSSASTTGATPSTNPTSANIRFHGNSMNESSNTATQRHDTSSNPPHPSSGGGLFSYPPLFTPPFAPGGHNYSQPPQRSSSVPSSGRRRVGVIHASTSRSNNPPSQGAASGPGFLADFFFPFFSGRSVPRRDGSSSSSSTAGVRGSSDSGSDRNNNNNNPDNQQPRGGGSSS